MKLRIEKELQKTEHSLKTKTMKKLLILSIVFLLMSCVPVHVIDKEYKIDHYWVTKGKYKYNYYLINGARSIYLHSNNLYSVDKKFNFNQR